jgi:large subunit ribosomal protein L7/L12
VTSPPEQIEVECPSCGTTYWDWYRGSVNLDLEGWEADDPEVQAYLRQCSSATCPKCRHVVELEMLLVDGDVWRFGGQA